MQRGLNCRQPYQIQIFLAATQAGGQSQLIQLTDRALSSVLGVLAMLGTSSRPRSYETVTCLMSEVFLPKRAWASGHCLNSTRLRKRYQTSRWPEAQ